MFSWTSIVQTLIFQNHHRCFPGSDIPSLYQIRQILAELILLVMGHMCINTCVAFVGPYADRNLFRGSIRSLRHAVLCVSPFTTMAISVSFHGVVGLQNGSRYQNDRKNHWRYDNFIATPSVNR
ncbi:hypothetical protein BDR06DRAFT_948806 [Suillus hirtellus]|nr:hypothetical protein BDR06DRAFT_948806 [Suillus hirtellus]